MEKVRKQKEYADNIRKHVLSKPVKIKSSRESPVPTAAPLSIVFEKQTLRLPRIPPRSVSDGSLGEAALTKHQKVIICPRLLSNNFFSVILDETLRKQGEKTINWNIKISPRYSKCTSSDRPFSSCICPIQECLLTPTKFTELSPFPTGTEAS